MWTQHQRITEAKISTYSTVDTKNTDWTQKAQPNFIFANIFIWFFFPILLSHLMIWYLEMCAVRVWGARHQQNRSIVRQIIVCVKFSIDRFMQSLYHMKSQAIYHQLPLAIRAVFIKYPLLEYHHVTLHFLIKTFMSHSYEPYHHIIIRPMFGWKFLTILNGIRYTKVKHFQYQSYNRH